MSLKGKKLGVRTVSGAVMVVIVVAAALLSKWSFAALTAIIAVGVMIEFIRLAAQREGVEPQLVFPVALAVGIIIECALRESALVFVTALSALPLFFIIEIFRHKERSLENAAVSVAAVAYGALPMALLLLTGVSPEGWRPWAVLSVVFTVWINDVFAFLVGCSVGRHKMCTRLSPKKSWEGFAGGFAAAVGFAMLAGWLMEGNIWLWAGLGAITALSAVAGDLVESMFKREFGVKDSGNVIPGHGGFMDRFDALLVAAVPAYFYITVLGL